MALEAERAQESPCTAGQVGWGSLLQGDTTWGSLPWVALEAERSGDHLGLGLGTEGPGWGCQGSVRSSQGAGWGVKAALGGRGFLPSQA